MIPAPGLGVDRFPNATQQAQTTQIVALGPGVAKTHEPADGRGRCVENADAVPFDHPPPAIGVGKVGRAFVDEAGGSQDERSIDDVTVPCDPARSSCAPPTIFFFEIKDPFQRRAGVHLIAAVGVDQALGRARGA